MNADGFAWSTPIPESEGAEYGAHTLTVNGLASVYRTAKTTPTKLGQFVTLWRRSEAGPIRPFDTSDRVMLFVVKVYDEEHSGHFVFPVETLVEHDIVSTNFSGGKRAVRVYAPGLRRPARKQSELSAGRFGISASSLMYSARLCSAH